MKKQLVIGIFLTLVIAAMPTIPNVGAGTITYSDVTLSGGFQTGHFNDIWDLTAGDIELSFTYDGNGLVDDAGCHAWAEFGVRSLSATKTVTLYADQDIAVGEVLATRIGNTLYVTFTITEPGWVITMTHLAVVDDPADFPMTKQGNPKVGQFQYSLPHYPAVTSYAYPPIDVSGLGDPLYIAAHANVEQPIEGCWETVWQIGDVEASQMDNPCDEFNYPTIVYGAQEFYVGTTPTNEFPWISRYDKNYAPTINIYFDHELKFGGRLLLSWSPGASGNEIWTASLDGTTLGTITRSGSYKTGWWSGYERFIETFNVNTIAAGSHTLTISFSKGDGAVWDWFRLEQPCVQKESAWGDGYSFPGNNWATYFELTPTADFNPTWMVEGSGVWLATDYDWTVNTFDPDPVGAPTLDLDDKLILQKGGGIGEGAYDLPSVPPNAGANHAVWFDRDGVDQWQAAMWGAIDDVTYNTGGIYDIVITLHAVDSTSGTAFMTINGEAQGFYDPNWHPGPADLMPAGMTFTGDMEHLQVFYGLYGYGATHSVTFSNIQVTQ